MHGTGLSCSLGRIFHDVGCTVCVRASDAEEIPCKRTKSWQYDHHGWLVGWLVGWLEDMSMFNLLILGGKRLQM